MMCCCSHDGSFPSLTFKSVSLYLIKGEANIYFSPNGIRMVMFHFGMYCILIDSDVDLLTHISLLRL